MDIGSVIQAIRKEKKIKQKALAESCNISITYLSQIENNKKDPTISTLTEISRNLEIPLPIIFFMALEENDIPPNKRDFFKQLNPTFMKVIKDFF